jgi:hypothetical protein
LTSALKFKLAVVARLRTPLDAWQPLKTTQLSISDRSKRVVADPLVMGLSLLFFIGTEHRH